MAVELPEPCPICALPLGQVGGFVVCSHCDTPHSSLRCGPCAAVGEYRGNPPLEDRR